MTQPIDDLLTLFKTFVHDTVNTAITAGGGTEQLTADPTTVLMDDFVDIGAVDDPNGYIVLEDEIDAEPIEEGPTRHLRWVISGFILYESRTDKDSLVIQSIKDQLRSLMNVNNATINTYTFRFISAPGYNTIPEAGRIDYNVEAIKHGVPAHV